MLRISLFAFGLLLALSSLAHASEYDFGHNAPLAHVYRDGVVADAANPGFVKYQRAMRRNWTRANEDGRPCAYVPGLQGNVWLPVERELTKTDLVFEAALKPFGKGQRADVFINKKKIGSKGFLYCRCDTPLGLLDFINVHLDFKSKRTRLMQCHEVKKFFLSKEMEYDVYSPMKPFVMGDFNAQMKNQRDAARFLLEEVSAHSHYRSYPVKASTFPSYLPRKAIDYIFVPDAYHVSHSEVIRRKVSDHNAVLVEFKPDQTEHN